MEVRLPHRDLELAQNRAALGVELERALEDRLGVRLAVDAVEPKQEAQRFGAPRFALDARHSLQRVGACESSRAREGVIEHEALDDALSGDPSAVARLVRLEREAAFQDRG